MADYKKFKREARFPVHRLPALFAYLKKHKSVYDKYGDPVAHLRKLMATKDSGGFNSFMDYISMRNKEFSEITNQVHAIVLEVSNFVADANPTYTKSDVSQVVTRAIPDLREILKDI